MRAAPSVVGTKWITVSIVPRHVSAVQKNAVTCLAPVSDCDAQNGVPGGSAQHGRRLIHVKSCRSDRNIIGHNSCCP
jgi:hypothetical protein